MVTPNPGEFSPDVDPRVIARQQYEDGSLPMELRLSPVEDFAQTPIHYYQRELELIQMLVDPEPTDAVADLGCANGRKLFQAMVDLDIDFPVVGIEPYPRGYLDSQRYHDFKYSPEPDTPPLHPANFMFLQSRAEAIAAKDNAFTALIANYVLYAVEDLDQSLREIKRVVQPDGFIFITTNGSKHMAIRHLLAKEVAVATAKALQLPVTLPITPANPFLAEDAPAILEAAELPVFGTNFGTWEEKQPMHIRQEQKEAYRQALITDVGYVALREPYRSNPELVREYEAEWRRKVDEIFGPFFEEVLIFKANSDADEEPSFQDWIDRALFVCRNAK